MKKRILIIHTGGTFAMTASEPDEMLIPGNLQSELVEHVPEITSIAKINVEIPFNQDSSESGIEEWQLLSKSIYSRMDKYDGFVVIHGTDTMAYTASALSFSLLNLRKPVILTGAQRPLSKLRSDARSNLIDAIELATMDIPEVIIVFGQHILRGNRSKKISTSSYDAFDSPNFPHLGEIGLKIDLHKNRLLKLQGASILLEGFIPKVALISVQPTLKPQWYERVFDTDLKIIILLAYGSGNLPAKEPNWLRFIENARKKDVGVVIGSHSLHGMVDLDLYEAGKKAQDAGAIGLGKMTYEAAYVKLQKILTLSSSIPEIYDRFSQNWAGEL